MHAMAKSNRLRPSCPMAYSEAELGIHVVLTVRLHEARGQKFRGWNSLDFNIIIALRPKAIFFFQIQCFILCSQVIYIGKRVQMHS
jgi:hypothetical protein